MTWVFSYFLKNELSEFLIASIASSIIPEVFCIIPVELGGVPAVVLLYGTSVFSPV
jgi:hypothetical protein